MIGAGTTARTVGSIMDRLFVQILTPPDNQMAQVRLATNVDESTEQFIIGGFTVPEDQGLLRQGSILELGQELTRVVSYDEPRSIVTVTRGEYGTVPEGHQVPFLMNLNPPYTRAAVFEAVADNIIQLYPQLFTIKHEYVAAVSNGVYPLSDDLAVEVLSTTEDFESTFDLGGRIVDFHPIAGGRALVTKSSPGALWLRYRRRMGVPTSESDRLEDLGVDPRWAQIVVVGAAADLLVGRDVPQARTEWVQAVLEAENIRVGSRMSIAGGLRQYRNMLIQDAQAEMKAEYRPRVNIRTAINQVT